MHILIVEDEAAIRDMIKFALADDNWVFAEADSFQDALLHLKTHKPDMILLDWMLPGKSGVELVKKLKQQPDTIDIPIIRLTARAEEEYLVRALKAGADDYVTKPFSPATLKARIAALSRRGPWQDPKGNIKLGAISLNADTQEAWAHGQLIKLKPKDFQLLHFFVQHAGRVYSRDQLLDFVWGQDAFHDERTVDVQIKRLRDALRPFECDHYVKTARSIGYRFSHE